MRVYISGKIGEEVISEATRQKFARAEAMLMAKGYEVFNPCDEKWQRTLRRSYEKDRQHEEAWIVNPASEAFQETMKQAFEWRELRRNLPDILLYDLHWLRTCDAIYMLEDWTKSDGANLELDFAQATGKKVLWQREEDAQCFRDDSDNYMDVWLPIDEEEDEV